MNKPDLDIIKSPSAERMRQMVTSAFYDRSRIGLWLFEVMGREYDGMEKWARELRYEAFPETCTWSIGIWEWVYGIETDETLPLDFRRGRILYKRLQKPPINPARIEAALSALTGVPVSITEFVADYTFEVKLDESELTAVNLEQMKRHLRAIKPSHLSFETQTHIITESTADDLHAGASAEFIRQFSFEEGAPLHEDGTVYDAGADYTIAREWSMEFTAIPDSVTNYIEGASYEIIKEASTE